MSHVALFLFSGVPWLCVVLSGSSFIFILFSDIVDVVS